MLFLVFGVCFLRSFRYFLGLMSSFRVIINLGGRREGVGVVCIRGRERRRVGLVIGRYGYYVSFSILA